MCNSRLGLLYYVIATLGLVHIAASMNHHTPTFEEYVHTHKPASTYLQTTHTYTDTHSILTVSIIKPSKVGVGKKLKSKIWSAYG